MSQFSKILKTHVSKLDIPIQTLSRSSGVDRSFIHHMLTGKRIPADKEVLESIMRALTLTPMQADELRQLYYIERIGENLYQSNMSVKTLLESLVSIDSSSPQIISSYHHDFTLFSQANVFTGSQNINRVLKAVLEEESVKENGYIKIMVQPEYQFLMDMLLTLSKENTELKIEHIFCLQKALPGNSENLFNISLLRVILPLLLSCTHYDAFIYYDNVDSRLNVTSVFPYLIITSDKVIGISYDYQHAALYLDQSFHKVYSDIYQRILHTCSKFTEKILDPMDFYMQYSFLEQGDDKRSQYFTVSLFPQPCLAYFLTSELLHKYALDIPMKNEVIHLLLERNTHYCERIKNGQEYTSIFTIEGLDSLWDTGRITEIPDEFYKPIQKEDCLDLIKTLYDSLLHTSYRACIINTQKMRITERLVISAINEISIFFIYIHPVKGMFYLAFNDTSISTSIFNFLNGLIESDLIYTKEETLEILQSKIKEYEQELCNSKKEA